MTHASVLEIHLDALQHNFNFFKRKLKKTTKTLGVVKAFGYGSDAVIIAKKLEKTGANYLAVAYAKEGVILRKEGIKLPILVLHPQEKSLKELINNCLEPNIYNPNILKAFIAEADTYKLNNYPIHLKFNTGLNRLGFAISQASEVFNTIKNTSSIKVTSVFSHLSASEDLDEKDFTNQQITLFNRLVATTKKALNYRPLFHLLNTSGVINYAEYQFDMVRIGVGLYGFGNDVAITNQLKSVVVLKSSISQINILRKGESVGYNRAYFATDNLKIATIPIGHADGISRQLGNAKGYIYINNKKAFIVGNVCMDMLMVDVTTINCTEGDEVIIYRDQQHLEDLATIQNTIPYELLTAISQRIDRKIV